MRRDGIRNVAIIAHVDHGKTTLVDQWLYQSGMFRTGELDKLAGGQHGLIMDSNPLERERGITILAKNCAITYRAADGEDVKINIIDTPGHADFGGEVERVLKMADGVVLLVDAFEGPMPQTRFVLSKAMEHGLKPIVLINKMDRPNSRPDDVVNEVFDLMVELGADDDALDFPVIYASAREGWAVMDLDEPRENLRCVFETILSHVPPPDVDIDAPVQILVTSLESSDYVGRIGIGRVFAGRLIEGQPVTVISREGEKTQQKVLQLFEFEGLGRKQVPVVIAGDICAVVGLSPIDIGDTICCAENPIQLPVIDVDEPTLNMTFRVNDSPFAGREGTYVTSRQIKDRLDKELEHNVALRVTDGRTPEEFNVSGRGMMHLGILLENMRREGFELAVGKPKVICREIDDRMCEPIETLVVDCPRECEGSVMALIGDRQAELVKMDAKSGTSGYVHMEFTIAARGLVGLRARMLNATRGLAIMHHTFCRYEPQRGSIPRRSNGVIVCTHTGPVTAYALDGLYDRGTFFVKPGDQVYEGQVAGENNKEGDLPANVTRGKALTNMRAAGKDGAARVRPAREMSLEVALEYIQEDELVEITPSSIRMRKRILLEVDRRRAARSAKS